MLEGDIQGLQPFSCEETSNIGTRWKRWLRSFKLYAGGKGVTNAEQKKSLLLHSAGVRVQDIFFTLPPESTQDDTVYEKAVKALDKQFTPQVNTPYERHVFRKMEQNPNETIDQYILRLRLQSETCEFWNEAAINEEIRDQVIECCLSINLKKKLLEKGRGLTLDQLKETARAFEQADRQAKEIGGESCLHRP